MTDEKKLVKALIDGSEEAFRTLIDLFQEKVLNTALGFVPNYQDAEDITQEVFVEVFRSVARFREEAKLSTWVYRIAVTKSLAFIRHRKRKKRINFFKALIGLDDHELSAVSDKFNHPGIQLENKERTKLLFEQIDQLPENQRIAFVLQKVEDKSQKEISEIMQMSESAVESLLFRAKKKLKQKLEHYYRKNMI